MLQLEVIGNLGANAELRNESGRKFVSLSIASTRRRKNAQGEDVETTEWVSATINGDGGNLLQYLTKGTKVYVVGEPALRMFHSEKDRMLKAGYNLYVNHLELIQTSNETVPRTLYDIEGHAFNVTKYYYCDAFEKGELYDRSGAVYTVQNKWVAPVQPQVAPTTEGEANNADSTTEQADSGENQAEEAKKTTKKK